ncbi:MAG: low specificity L-threonine aldolase [Pseudomonadota bacterium]
MRNIKPQQFASDNNAGMCPQALERFLEANNAGHAVGYGDDEWTARAIQHIQDLFECDATVFFVFNGTAANSLALAQLTKSYNAVIAHGFSHIQIDEAGGPSFMSGGATLMTADTPAAKLTPTVVEELATKFVGVHHVKPAALSITQSTELGTVYTTDEVRELTGLAKKHDLRVHMDGARFANAVATTGATPAELSWKAGVDVLCFGGVKNGLAVGEAILFFDKQLAHEFEWRIKQSGHLNSKMRMVTSAWIGLLENNTWIANAKHANQMALRLAEALTTKAGAEIMYPVEANAVFARIPESVQEAMRARGWSFYTFLPPLGCRLMCAWDTEEATIEAFTADLAEIA